MNISITNSLRDVDIPTGSMGGERTFDGGELEIASSRIYRRFALEVRNLNVSSGGLNIDLEPRRDGNDIIHLQPIERLIPAKTFLRVWRLDFHFIFFGG